MISGCRCHSQSQSWTCTPSGSQNFRTVAYGKADLPCAYRRSPAAEELGLVLDIALLAVLLEVRGDRRLVAAEQHQPVPAEQVR